MNKAAADSASRQQWTLIRGARQLLTLRGASGPRRGTAISNLGIITDGAVLLRNGLIEKVGTARQIENLAAARNAREIDAGGRVVMPAFVDPDVALAAPGARTSAKGDRPETDIRRMSQRRLAGEATSTAADLTRYGVLTVGSHTLFAPDLPNTLKALRLHQEMQSKPLRIRSVFSPPWFASDAETAHFTRLSQTWMPAVFRKQLASLMEIPAAATWAEDSQTLAVAAADAGFNSRFRVTGLLSPELLELAYSAGAVALLGTAPEITNLSRSLADIGCVQVLLASDILAGKSASVRSVTDDGLPIALASGYRTDSLASLNPQYLLHMAEQHLDLTAEESIVASTYNAACSLRLSHVTGSLEVGKSADICVMDVGDYHELARRAGHHDTWLVMRAGRVVYQRPNLTFDLVTTAP